MQLTEEQNNIIKLSSGKHLVLAPPGTGKTEIVSQRINQALLKKISPNEMLCLTFTNRAAKSMKSRIESQFGDTGVFIGNIHTFCLHYLKENHVLNNASLLLDEDEASAIFREAILEISANFEDHFWTYENHDDYLAVSNTIFALKENPSLQFEIKQKNFFHHALNDKNFNNELFKTIIRLSNIHLYHFPKEIINELFYDNINDIEQKQKGSPITKRDYEKGCKYLLEIYFKLKKEVNGVDFDDLLGLTFQHLKQNENANFKYKWLQIDEVQDLNPIQWKIIDEITNDDTHIVYFGDYEQAIYSFLDAKLENLHEIEKTAKIHNFTKNFRSPDYLLNFYVKFCKTFLKPKWKKEPVAHNTSLKDKASLCFRHIEGDTDRESTYVATRILPNLPTEENKAILVRTNNQADDYGKLLEYHGLEYFKISGFDIMKYQLVKTTLSVMCVLADKNDRASWIRIFYAFSNLATLKEARNFIVDSFNFGIHPHDFIFEDYFVLEDFRNLLENDRIVVFDTETTGLDTQNDDIIQIAAVEIVNGKIGKLFNAYIDTEKSLDDTVEIHKITKDFLSQNAIDRETAFKDFIDFVGDSAIVAHNLKYDYEIIGSNFQRFNLALSTKVQYYDSIELCKRMFPDFPTYKLEYLIKRLEVQGVNSHNAIDDVKATANLLFTLFKDKDQYFLDRANFLKENRNTVKAFRAKFKDFYKELLQQKDKDGTLAELFKQIGVFYGIETKAEVPRDIFKVLNFMNHISGKDNINTLLEKHIFDFTTYKESDLVTGKEKVIISTVHKAKGLEFENVIIPGCYHNNFPIYFAVISDDQKALEEEARLFYVAMSRSQKRLIFTSPTKHKQRGTYIDGKFVPEDLLLNNYIQLLAEYLDYKIIN